MSVKRLRQRVRGFHHDDSGAILLLSLASILIIMMLSWVIVDAGKSARDKVELQAAADMSAYSHASVKSRTMNMLAYTNVAKRSVVGILSMYQGMYSGFVAWINQKWRRCVRGSVRSCSDAWVNSWMFVAEATQDQWKFAGGEIGRYHRADVEALDNYQQYMMALTPWWAYSEALVRGLRNGATTVASFPPPPGNVMTVGALLSSLKPAATGEVKVYKPKEGGPGTGHIGVGGGGSGACESFKSSSVVREAMMIDYFPLERMPWGNYNAACINGDSLASVMKSDPAYLAEHFANSYHHKSRSNMGAASTRAWIYGLASFGVGYSFAKGRLGKNARPYRFRRMTESAWLSATSSLVFAYGIRPEKFDAERKKYGFMSQEYSLESEDAEDLYKPAGYWSLARSEMSYQEEELSPFYPSWTARLRPVALKGEWKGADYNLHEAYQKALPYLALTSVIGSNVVNSENAEIAATKQDFINMDRITRSFGHSTIDGIAK